jgi:hypothetical protein
MLLGKLARLSVILIAVLAVASISFAAAATVAAGKSKSTTTVSIKSRGTIAASAFGPGANVTITYSCFPSGGGKGGYSSFGNVGLTDIHGNQGFAFFHPTCNDASHTIVVFVQAGFSAGAAAANAFVCGFDCNFASREIRLV